jgi:hypothetical protein
MGLLNILNKVVDKVGKVVDKAVDKGREFYKKAKDYFTGTRAANDELVKEVQKQREYSNRDSSTVDIYAKLTTEYQNKMKSFSEELEQQCIEFYVRHFEAFIEGLEKEGDKSKVQSIVKEGEKKLNGTIKNYINKKVSIDNFEFKSIIEKPSDYNKKNEMNDFQERISVQARDLFCRKLEEICKKQNDDIQAYFNSQINDLKTKNQKIIEEFEQLQKITTQDESEKNSELIKRSVIIAGCDYILNKI